MSRELAALGCQMLRLSFAADSSVIDFEQPYGPENADRIRSRRTDLVNLRTEIDSGRLELECVIHAVPHLVDAECAGQPSTGVVEAVGTQWVEAVLAEGPDAVVAKVPWPADDDFEMWCALIASAMLASISLRLKSSILLVLAPSTLIDEDAR